MTASEHTHLAQRQAYKFMLDLPTRWMDNDVYGHVNNVVYYSYFDTVINCYLIDHAGFDFKNAAIIGVVAETKCRFYRSFSYPETVQAGLAVSHIGRSSVRYELALFGQGEDSARAQGHFVHVFIDRVSGKPQKLPQDLFKALELIRPNG